MSLLAARAGGAERGTANVEGGAGPPESMSPNLSGTVRVGASDTGMAAPSPEVFVATAAAVTGSVTTFWAAEGSTAGGEDGTKSALLYWVATDTRRGSAPRRAALAYLGENMACFLRASW